MAGSKSQELNEILSSDSYNDDSEEFSLLLQKGEEILSSSSHKKKTKPAFLERAKKVLAGYLKDHAFITVLVAASVRQSFLTFF